MYSNVFDSVRISIPEQISAEGLLFTSILNGFHPALSLNQAVDSITLLNIAKKTPILFQFFQDSLIRIQTPQEYAACSSISRAIDRYLTYALSALAAGERNPFRFSCLPFLYESGYTDPQIQEIYGCMLKALEGEQPSLVRNAASIVGAEHADELEFYLKTISDLKRAVNSAVCDPRPPQKAFSLSNRIQFYFQQTVERNSDSDFVWAWRTIQKKVEKQTGTFAIDSRSRLYTEIEQVDSNQDLQRELKDFVDLCYNEVVASSINDDEEIMMVYASPHRSPDIDSCFRTGSSLSMEQKILLDRAKKSRNGYLTWEKLYETIHQCEAFRNTPDQWAEQMRKACKEASVDQFDEACKVGAKFVCRVLMSHCCDFKILNGFACQGTDQFLWHIIQCLGLDVVGNLEEYRKMSAHVADGIEYKRLPSLLVQDVHVKERL